MPLKMIVLIKQVPDTKNITAKAMNDDGTVNRSALPSIFNPEDLNALEMALTLRDAHGGHITVVCMGPPNAAEQLREALMRGADDVAFLTDRAYAVADTLATAYAITCAIRKIGDADLVFAGRQAIDGDTAQVGPQVAGALGVPQVTYVAEILDVAPDHIRARRLIDGGYEVVDVRLPALLTVVDEANEPRSRVAKRMMHYKRARTAMEVRDVIAQQLDPEKGKPDPELLAQHCAEPLADLERQGLLIPVWGPADIDADIEQCGKKGSPTQVKNINFVTLVAGEHKNVEPTKDGVDALVHELIEDHTLD